jgi:hypothetical protein
MGYLEKAIPAAWLSGPEIAKLQDIARHDGENG